MKLYTIVLAATLTLLSSSFAGFSQTLNDLPIISGKVIDSTTHTPVEYATVSLRAENTVKTIITNADGYFKFTGLTHLAYSLTFTSIEYTSKRVTADLRDTSLKSVDLGIIYIARSLNNLKEVKITAERPIIKREIDRISYDMQADPESKGSTVLEMARKIPFLSLDAGDNILFKGNTDYKIFVDGKPSGIMDRNAKDVLRSMPASAIKTIEVITSPSAKYDAEGTAGIINIITNKVASDYNGTFNISERSPVGGPSIGGSVTTRQNKLGIAAFAGTNRYTAPLTRNSNQRLTDQSSLFQNNTTQSNSQSPYLNAELSYEADSLNLLSAQFNINTSIANGTGNQHALITDKNITTAYDMLDNNRSENSGSDVIFNYQLGFKADKSKLLTASYRHSVYDNNSSNNISLYNKVNYDLPNYNQFNNTRSVNNTFQIDYVQKVNKASIEAGVKALLRNSISDFQYHAFNDLSGQFEPDKARSNKFNNNQRVFGAYNSYQYSSNKWGVKTGVRIEQTIFDADFISSSSQIKQNYFNVVPTITINRKLNNSSNLTLGFSQSIRRPGVNKLNPYVDRSNPNFQTTGNPALRPVLLNRVQLGYSKFGKGSLNFSLDYIFSNNVDLRVSYFDALTNITYSTFQNVGKSSELNNNLNISYPITKKWNFSFNGNANFVKTEGFVNNEFIKNRWFLYSASVSTGYKINDMWRLSANLRVVGPGMVSFQATSNTLTSMSVGVNKDIVKDKLTFSASVSNPFSKYRTNRIETIGPDFLQVSNNQEYFRLFNASLNYRFGQLRDALKKSKRGLTNDDSN